MDIGGTRTKYGLVDLNKREIIAKRVLPTQTSGRKAFIQTTDQVVKDLCRLSSIPREDIMAGGVGIPGFVDDDIISMVWESLSFMEGSGFGSALEEGLGFRLRLDNDARVVALGEAHFGGYTTVAAERSGIPQRVLSLTIGTGLGVAMVVNGKLQETSSINHLAGHIPIRPGASSCFCGFSGCFESLVGANALIRNYRIVGGLDPDQADSPWIDIQEIISMAMAGEAQSVQAVNQLCADLVVGLNAYIYIYGPEVIVIGGGLATVLSKWLPTIHNGLFAKPYKTYRVNVVTSSLRELAGLYGSASLWDV